MEVVKGNFEKGDKQRSKALEVMATATDVLTEQGVNPDDVLILLYDNEENMFQFFTNTGSPDALFLLENGRKAILGG